MTVPVLAIEGLTLALPRLGDRDYAVKDASFTIEKGETLCVVGESGSGKSMIAHAIMGLLPKVIKPLHGAIRLSGRDLLGMDRSAMQAIRGRSVGMVFQEPMTSLNPVMRIERQIMEMFEAHGLYDRRARRSRATALLDEVGLPDPARIARAYPHELSGGQRQRVMIAMALALQPQLLIADEPTTALDVTTQKKILRLIDDMRKKTGTAVLFITHDMGVVAEIADRIVVLQSGAIVESGTTYDVLKKAKHPYTQKLLQAVPALKPPAPSKSLSPAIVLQGTDLVKTYRKRGAFGSASQVSALDRVSFSLGQAETLGIVGESGSGKSTLGRCCVKLIEPDKGRLALGETDWSSLRGQELRAQRKRIQIVFQDPFASLNPRQTVGMIVSSGPIAYGTSRNQALADARQLLARVGLSESAIDRYPHEFSGGQRQRIGIARALALRPEILIADEAVSALDVSVQAQILELIKDIQKELGLAILFITHDLRVAAQICDRIIVMKKGKIVEEGLVNRIFEDPQDSYTRELIESVPGSHYFK